MLPDCTPLRVAVLRFKPARSAEVRIAFGPIR